MRKRLDDLFSPLMLLLAIAVVLAGSYRLSHSISRMGVERALLPVAPVHFETSSSKLDPPPEPAPAPELTDEIPPCIYNSAIPLSAELQAVLHDACLESGVPEALALGVIQVESCFQVDADNGQCYGLMQLNRDYFPDELSPADNLREGIAYLGRLLDQYRDPAAALTAYHAGYDTGRRAYANAVLEAAEWWVSR